MKPMNTHPLRHWSGPELAAARRRVGLHRLALAQALGASPRLVAAWELRREPLPASAAAAIQQAIVAGRLAMAGRERERLTRLQSNIPGKRER